MKGRRIRESAATEGRRDSLDDRALAALRAQWNDYELPDETLRRSLGFACVRLRLAFVDLWDVCMERIRA